MDWEPLRARLLNAYRRLRLRLPFGSYAMPQRRLTGLRVICAWCGDVIEEGNGAGEVSHGICKDCYRLERERHGHQ